MSIVVESPNSSLEDAAYNTSCFCLSEAENETCGCGDNGTAWDELVSGPPLYLYIYVTVINVIVFVVGIVGNLLVVQVVLRTRSMHRRINYFLVSLSVADLSVLLVCMPVALLEFYGKDRWFIGLAMCKIVPFLESASHQCSVLTLLAIGCERYWGICHPLKQSVVSRLTSPYVVIPAVWILSSFVSLPYALLSDIEVEYFYDGSQVEVCRTDISSELARAYIVVVFVMCLVLPLVLLTTMYSAIISTLLNSTTIASNGSPSNMRLGSMQADSLHNSRAVASRHQVVRMMVAVMILYFICLLPMRIFQLVFVFSPGSKERLGFEPYLNTVNFGRILIYINSAGNPIIYGWLSSNFRAAFLQSFASCCGRSRRDSAYNLKFGTTNYRSTNQDNLNSRRNTLTTQVSTMYGKNNLIIDPAAVRSDSRKSSAAFLAEAANAPLPLRPLGDKVDLEVTLLKDDNGKGPNAAYV